MRVDMHVHTVYSGDSEIDPRYAIIQAREAGLDALCITEHNSYNKSAPVLTAGTELGFPIFRGVEISTTIGHLLVYGLKDDSWLERRHWGRLNGETILAAVAARGGVVVVAHPYKAGNQFYGDHLVAAHPEIVAVETVNGSCSPEQNRQAAALAQRLGLPGIGGSDAHRLHEIGTGYTVFPQKIRSEAELVTALRAGGFWPSGRLNSGDIG